jgi:hypothetical protein
MDYRIVLFGLSLTGYFYNISSDIRKRKLSYLIWFLSNSGWAVHNYFLHEYEAMFLFIVYNCLSLYGLIKCSK